MNVKPTRNLLGAAIAVLLVAPAVAAQQSSTTAPVPRNGLGFRAALGWTSISGDYGRLLTSGFPAEGGLWYQTGPFRGGLNIHVASYDVIAPFESQSVSQVELAASALWRFRTGSRLQPLLGVRAGLIRFKPEGALFDPTPPGPDVLPGENAAPDRSGFVAGFTGGFEYWINPHLAFGIDGTFRFYSTDRLDLLIFGATELEKGRAADVKLGVEWKP